MLNHDDLRDYMARVPGPWVLKPRSEASSMGIRKVDAEEALWPILDELGDRQSYYVLERFVPGDVFHVDSVVWNKHVLFAVASQYGVPPMTVYQGGGVFATSVIPYNSPADQTLQALNREVISAMGMVRGVIHAEFIRGQDGTFYFLEIAARGRRGQHRPHGGTCDRHQPLARWARVELAHLRQEEYELPPVRHDYAGLVVSLARQQRPDTSAYADPELVWRLDKEHHVGFIVAAPSHARVQELDRRATSTAWRWTSGPWRRRRVGSGPCRKGGHRDTQRGTEIHGGRACGKD